MDEQVITSVDMMPIYQEVSDNFSQLTVDEYLNSKLLLIKQDIVKLRVALELAKSRVNRRNLTQNMMNAYQKIMLIRNMLLGDSSIITYRLYVRSNDLDEVKIIDLTEEQMMRYVERSGDNLRLRRHFTDIEQLKNNTDVQNKFDKHFNTVQNGLTHPEKGVKSRTNNFIVNDYIVNKYGQLNNYVWTENPGPRGKSAYTRKLFNRGWIYQAFDATTYDLYAARTNAHQVIDESTFEKSYFTIHLSYDNVVGFKGGDVGLNQIKSNMASLMSITTLINYLTLIEQILTPALWSNKKELAMFIKDIFTSEDSLTPKINKSINKNVDQLLKTLTFSKQNLTI